MEGGDEEGRERREGCSGGHLSLIAFLPRRYSMQTTTASIVGASMLLS